MFERFTARARRVLVLAQEEARELDHGFIGTEHILLGLLREREGLGAKALVELGVDIDTCRERVVEYVKPGEPSPGGRRRTAIPFTPRSKKVLELSLQQALALHHNYIGTEHLLLALMREGDGVGAQVLIGFGLTEIKVRAQVMALLQDYVAGIERKAKVEGKTPAGAKVEAAATRAAGPHPVGTQHYLLGLLEDESWLACLVLKSFGVTWEAVQARINELGAGIGTEDEVPLSFATTVGGGGVTIRIDDPDLAAKVQRGELAVTFTATGSRPPADAGAAAAAPAEDPAVSPDGADQADRADGADQSDDEADDAEGKSGS